jgi:hypothetical protein
MRKTKSCYESYTCSFTVLDKKINVREADFILSDRVLWLLFPPHDSYSHAQRGRQKKKGARGWRYLYPGVTFAAIAFQSRSASVDLGAFPTMVDDLAI